MLFDLVSDKDQKSLRNRELTLLEKLEVVKNFYPTFRRDILKLAIEVINYVTNRI